MPGQRSSRSISGERMLGTVLGGIMRATWITPIVSLLLHSGIILPEVSLPFWGILALLLAPQALSWALGDRRGTRLWMALAGLAIVAGAALLLSRSAEMGPLEQIRELMGGNWQVGFPSSVALFLIALTLWLQGMSSQWNRYRQAWRGFATGVVVLCFLAMLSKLDPAIFGVELGGAMMGFLATGILSLALQSAAGSLDFEEQRVGRRLPISRPWLVALLIILIVVMGGGWLLARSLSPELVDAVLSTIRRFAAKVAEGLAWALAQILRGIFYLLDPLIKRFLGMTAVEPNLNPLQDMADQLQQGATDPTLASSAPAWMQTATNISLLLLAVGVVLWLLVRAWRRPKSRPENLAAEERSSVFSRDLLLEQLRRLAPWRRSGARSEFFVDIAQPDSPVGRARRALQRVLETARKAKLARHPSQTVPEYARYLVNRKAASHEDALRLTAIYTQARYGGLVSAESAAQAEAASTRICTELEKG